MSHAKKKRMKQEKSTGKRAEHMRGTTIFLSTRTVFSIIYYLQKKTYWSLIYLKSSPT